MSYSDLAKALHVELSGAPKPEELIRFIMSELRNSDPQIRRIAAQTLGEIKPTDPGIHHALVSALKDSHWVFRHSVSRLLKSIKPTDPSVYRSLVALHDSVSPENGRDDVEGVLNALENDAPSRSKLIHNLILEFRHVGEKEKHEIVAALHRLRVDGAEVTLLREKAEHDQGGLRCSRKSL